VGLLHAAGRRGRLPRRLKLEHKKINDRRNNIHGKGVETDVA
jgi:hypothetical protein